MSADPAPDAHKLIGSSGRSLKMDKMCAHKALPAQTPLHPCTKIHWYVFHMGRFYAKDLTNLWRSGRASKNYYPTLYSDNPQTVCTGVCLHWDENWKMGSQTATAVKMCSLWCKAEALQRMVLLFLESSEMMNINFYKDADPHFFCVHSGGRHKYHGCFCLHPPP